MNFESPNLFISYKHIETNDPEKMEELMLIIQVKSKKPINFSTPTYNNNKWHSWYSYDFAKDIKSKDKINIEYNDVKDKVIK